MWGFFTKLSVRGSAGDKKWTQSDVRFVKMRGQNDQKSMKRRINWIEK